MAKTPMSPTPPMRAEHGFTLLELLLVLVVLALLAGLGASVMLAPSARSGQQAQDRLESLLAHARSTAISQGKTVEVKCEANRVISTAGVLALTLSADTSLRCQPALADLRQPDAIVFYPDGSATPGIVDVVVQGQGVQVRVEWWGGLASSASR
jgi:type II secretion system protein H